MTNGPIRGVVLFSGSASSLRFLKANDPNWGMRYKIVGAFCDVLGASGISYAKNASIPTHMLDFTAWRQKYGIGRTDLKGREAYFEEVLHLVMDWEPEFILCSGCMLLITDPFLSRFEGRILNVHPADLSILTDSAERKYAGLNVVARTMEAGDPTRSTVHLVTHKPDQGPIIAISAALPYQPGGDPGDHQDKMKAACDGPAYRAALDMLIRIGWPKIPWHQQ